MVLAWLGANVTFQFLEVVVAEGTDTTDGICVLVPDCTLVDAVDTVPVVVNVVVNDVCQPFTPVETMLPIVMSTRDGAGVVVVPTVCGALGLIVILSRRVGAPVVGAPVAM